MIKRIQSSLQTFSGAMMVPIILLVLVGFFVGIGSAMTNYILTKGTFLHSLFSMVANLGFMFMSNLPVWFAVAITFTLAKKEKGWAAFTGLIMYLSYHICIQTWAGANGWTADTTSVAALMSSGYSHEAALTFNSLWGNTLGIFSYDMGIFSGIVVGLVTSWIHNRFVDTELPEMFGFFAGTKSVVIISVLSAIPLAIITYYIWPYIGKGLSGLANYITKSGLFGTFVFGALDKALLPLGLHHLIAFPIEYSAVGGVMEIDGVVYEGVKNIMNAQAASADATGYITRNFTNGRLLFQLAGIPGAAYAIYKEAKKDNQKKVSSILLPAVFTLALVGISEPFEYTFLFLAPKLYYLVYVPLCGLCYVLAEVTNISINGTALLFMIPNLFQPHKVNIKALIWLLPLAFVVFYLAFRYFIRKWNLNTPGRLTDEAELISKKEYRKAQEESSQAQAGTLEEKIVEAFGGSDNIESVTNCATRLRVTVKNKELVAPDEIWVNELEANGVTKMGENYQIIYGVQVQNISTRVKDILGIE